MAGNLADVAHARPLSSTNKMLRSQDGIDDTSSSYDLDLLNTTDGLDQQSYHYQFCQMGFAFVPAFPLVSQPHLGKSLRICLMHKDINRVCARRARAYVTRCSDVPEEKRVGVVVVDHGSRRSSANSMLDDVVTKVSARTSFPVFPAHMELASPTISDAIKECARHGVSHIVVVPFFLAPGRHVTHDVPSLVQDAVQKHHPNISFSIRPHIGAHDAVIDAVVDHATFDDAVFQDDIQTDA